MTGESQLEKNRRIFFPYMHRVVAEMTRKALEHSKSPRFAYYTTSETAFNIIKNKEIWMRNVTTMNDYMEVKHGLTCLQSAYAQKALNDRFTALIDSCHPGLTAETENMFSAWLTAIQNDTYITCLSEHLDGEDKHGRLSMWRAYGGRSGVALILNSDVILGESDILGATSSPVAYKDEAGVAFEFGVVVDNIENSIEYVRSMDRENLKNMIFSMFLFSVLGTKHPGFHEEKEWRVVSSPKIYGAGFTTQDVEVVRGIPQIVSKIKLDNNYPDELAGIAIPNLLDRIIIGPTEFPEVMRKAFVSLLLEANVADAADKVFVSHLPLRNLD